MSYWVADNERSHCTDCHNEFDLWNRRHHCRRCGEIFCDVCSSQRCLVPLEEILSPPNTLTLLDDKVAHRVCNRCAIKPTAVGIVLPVVSDANINEVDNNPKPQLPPQLRGEDEGAIDEEKHSVSYSLKVPPFCEVNRRILISLLNDTELRFQLPIGCKPGDEIVAMIPIDRIPASSSSSSTLSSSRPDSAPRNSESFGNQKKSGDPAASDAAEDHSDLLRVCLNCDKEHLQQAKVCCACDSVLPSVTVERPDSIKLPETHVLELEFGVKTKSCTIRVPSDYQEGDQTFFALIDDKLWTVICPMNTVGGTRIAVALPDKSKAGNTAAKHSVRNAGTRRSQSSGLLSRLMQKSPLSSTSSELGYASKNQGHSNTVSKSRNAMVDRSSPSTIGISRSLSLSNVFAGLYTPKADADDSHSRLVRELDVDYRSDIGNSSSKSLDTPLTAAPKVIISQDTFDLDVSVRKQLLPSLQEHDDPEMAELGPSFSRNNSWDTPCRGSDAEEECKSDVLHLLHVQGQLQSPPVLGTTGTGDKAMDSHASKCPSTEKSSKSPSEAIENSDGSDSSTHTSVDQSQYLSPGQMKIRLLTTELDEVALSPPMSM